MYKFVIYMLIIMVGMMMFALQFDEELAMQNLFRAKYAVNRSVHAAAQQLDDNKLAEGTLSINPIQAQKTALQYLQSNLNLDSDNRPLPGSFLKAKVKVLLFEIVNEDEQFPYTFQSIEYEYSVTLERPGAIMIIHVEYPRTFAMIDPIVWEIKGAAELVY